MPFPLPGDLPDPGIEPASLLSPTLVGRVFTTSATWEAFPSFSTFHLACVFPTLIANLCSYCHHSNFFFLLLGLSFYYFVVVLLLPSLS